MTFCRKECDCYRQYTDTLGKSFGRCLGTKDIETCDCGGDESKCDFYPEKRKRSRKTSSGAYVVSWDFSNGNDVGVLLVGIRRNGQLKTVNAFQGEEAYDIYKKLSTKKAGDPEIKVGSAVDLDKE